MAIKRTDNAKRLLEHIDREAALAQEQGTNAAVGTPMNPSFQVMTIANVITFCRLILTIAFLVLFVSGGNRALALFFYAIAAITDFLDGQVARRTQTVSWLGKIMDPIMDRVLLFTGVLALVISGELPLWVALFIIGRDVYLTIGGFVVSRFRRRPIDVVYVGKAATAFLMTGFCLMLLGQPTIDGLGLTGLSWLPGLNSGSASLGTFVVYVGCVLSLVTAVVYTYKGYVIVKAALDAGKGSALGKGR